MCRQARGERRGESAESSVEVGPFHIPIHIVGRRCTHDEGPGLVEHHTVGSRGAPHYRSRLVRDSHEDNEGHSRVAQLSPVSTVTIWTST